MLNYFMEPISINDSGTILVVNFKIRKIFLLEDLFLGVEPQHYFTILTGINHVVERILLSLGRMIGSLCGQFIQRHWRLRCSEAISFVGFSSIGKYIY
jgi:hypothetical protein